MERTVTKNILEIASMYNTIDGIWWMENNEFPSRVDYRTFTSYTKPWYTWVDENIDIIITNHSARSNETNVKLKHVYGRLKADRNILISWRIDHEYGKGKVRINGLEVLYSRSFSHDFEPEMIDELLKDVKLEEERKSQVYMVVQRHHGLDLQDFNIDIPTMDIELNYGPEWADKHTQLLEALTGGKKKGIALLHGLPGTGKSMYIRHIIATLCEAKTVIYLPNQLINNITDPAFIPLMAEYQGAVLIIEDADEAIKSRKTGGGIVDKLLNLADGILSDFLGMQIICTFNNDISSIDDALLRKGRLILKHQFGKLSIESAQKLSNKLGFRTTIKDEMTLAEIYNQDDKLSEVKDETKKIGFGR
jgi:hypothetical protein